jgi:hypothetical protein
MGLGGGVVVVEGLVVKVVFDEDGSSTSQLPASKAVLEFNLVSRVSILRRVDAPRKDECCYNSDPHFELVCVASVDSDEHTEA